MEWNEIWTTILARVLSIKWFGQNILFFPLFMYRLRPAFTECCILPYWYLLLLMPENNILTHLYISLKFVVISRSTFILLFTYSVTTVDNEGCDVHLVVVTYIKFPTCLACWKDVYWSYWRLPLIWLKLKMLLCFVWQIFATNLVQF